MKWQFGNIRTKLIGAFILISVLLVLGTGTLSYFSARDSLQNEAFSGIEALRETRGEQVQNWFTDRQREVRVLAENPDVIRAAAAIKNGIDTSNFYGDTQAERLAGIQGAFSQQPELEDDGSEYGAVHARFHPFFVETRSIYNYDDIFLVSSTGRVIYSVQKNEEFTSDLTDEAHINTPPGVLFQKIKLTPVEDFVTFTDFQYYDPAGKPVAFFATPVLRNDDWLGALIVSLPVDRLNTLMATRRGLGRTGESYIVGPDFLFRTDSRFLSDMNVETTILNEEIRANTEAVQAALAGETDTQLIENYRGVEVVSAWSPLVIDRPGEPLEWALIVEKQNSEVVQPANDLLSSVILTSLAATAIVLLLAYFLAGQISSPVQNLTRVAEEITAGDLDKRAYIKSNDEVGILADAFNQMTDELSRSIHDLKEAHAVALEASRLKSEFLSTISHELRTPLNAIEGYTGIMLMGMNVEINDKARYMVERIEANSHRLLALINEVLDISRIESGRFELLTEAINIQQMASIWEKRMEGLATQKNIELQIHIDEQMPEIVYGDEEAITKITSNLLSNAFKFTSEGSVTVHVFPYHDRWKIAVADTGIGIPEDARAYIFDEFRQVDGSFRRQYGGTGLGLAIVKKLAEQMGGTIILESELNKGSKFTVDLPLRLVPQIQKAG